MKLGSYLAGLQDRSLPEALDLLVAWGLEAGELAAGGFSGQEHCPVQPLRESAAAREGLLAEFDRRGLELTALNANGNPLHPDPRVGPQHRQDLFDAIDLAGKLGVGRVIAMPGMPGTPGGGPMNWVVAPLDSGLLDIRNRQWDEEFVPFWKEAASRAEAAGVTVCIEIHSHALVFNTPSALRLFEEVGSDALGINMDPSHLWWQGIDPLVAIRHLGSRIKHAHGKDTRIDDEAVAYGGFLDDRWRKPGPGDPQYSQGGPFLLNLPPVNPPWEFVAPGRGHGVDWWTAFARELQAIDSGIPISIELFDPELSLMEGVPYAADVLRQARAGAAAAPAE